MNVRPLPLFAVVAACAVFLFALAPISRAADAVAGLPVGWGLDDAGQASPPADIAPIIAVSAGADHTLALSSDHTVTGWGSNAYGQLNIPVDLAESTASIAAVPVVPPVVCIAVAAGEEFSLALKSDGTVEGWGRNDVGQINIPSNLSNVIAIAAGRYFGLALKSDGTVIAWGYGPFGELNVPTGQLNGVTAISAGRYHALALNANGSVVAWGSNKQKQLNVPVGLTGALAIAAGGYHSLALGSNHKVVGWGSNVYGQAKPPTNLVNVTAISAGFNHSLALNGSGLVIGWGLNTSGQVTSPKGLVAVVAIDSGGNHNVAITQGPVATIAGAPKIKTSKKTYTLTGTATDGDSQGIADADMDPATDDNGVASVEVKVNDADYVPATTVFNAVTNTNDWTLDLPMPKGRTSIHVRAVDTDGHGSAIQQAVIVRD